MTASTTPSLSKIYPYSDLGPFYKQHSYQLSNSPLIFLKKTLQNTLTPRRLTIVNWKFTVFDLFYEFPNKRIKKICVWLKIYRTIKRGIANKFILLIVGAGGGYVTNGASPSNLLAGVTFQDKDWWAQIFQ